MKDEQINNLLHTSVDDCRTSLRFTADLVMLRQLLVRCQALGHKARAGAVSTRIRQLEKANKCAS